MADECPIENMRSANDHELNCEVNELKVRRAVCQEKNPIPSAVATGFKTRRSRLRQFKGTPRCCRFTKTKSCSSVQSDWFWMALSASTATFGRATNRSRAAVLTVPN